MDVARAFDEKDEDEVDENDASLNGERIFVRVILISFNTIVYSFFFITLAVYLFLYPSISVRVYVDEREYNDHRLFIATFSSL